MPFHIPVRPAPSMRLALAAILALPLAAAAQTNAQVGDTTFEPPVGRPTWESGRAPRVLLDEAHHNFHTVAGRYATFVKLLRRDGLTVTPNRVPFDSASLAGVQLLVIANALAAVNDTQWALPTPSAFTAAEIEAVRRWVERGGSLFLIADHMPFPGAAADLAAAFGFRFENGFATDASGNTGELGFRRSDRSLGDHPVTRGRAAAERIDSVRTFTGQAFRSPKGATVLLPMPAGSLVLLSKVAWEFPPETPRVRADSLAQGAVLRYGRGRLAVFGEAAMFSAQIAGQSRRPMGMNSPNAAQNPQFLLNLIHWLLGVLPDR